MLRDFYQIFFELCNSSFAIASVYLNTYGEVSSHSQTTISLTDKIPHQGWAGLGWAGLGWAGLRAHSINSPSKTWSPS